MGKQKHFYVHMAVYASCLQSHIQKTHTQIKPLLADVMD